MVRGNQADLKKIFLLGLITAIVSTGCGLKKSKKHQENTKLGTIAYLDSKALKKLKQEGVKVRAVHKETSLYHLQDITQKEVEKILPDTESLQNIRITYEKPFEETQEQPKSDPIIEKAIEIVESCDDKAAIPRPVIQFVNPENEERPQIATVNKTNVKLTAKGSLTADQYEQMLKEEEEELAEAKQTSAAEENLTQELSNKKVIATSTTANLNFVWNIQGSKHSSLHPVQLGQDFAMVPDLRGNISVVLFLQDKVTMGCAIVPVKITATENKQLMKVEPATGWNEFTAQSFYHVRQIDTEQAWDYAQGEGSVIAVIDSGVNYNHPDLNQNIFVNKKEVPSNGLDDDGNGYVDDVYGWDFVNGDNQPYDDGGHGTHVAGIAAASSFGIAPRAKILPLKASSGGSLTLVTILEATYYAADMGVDVINMSFGAPNNSDSEQARKILRIQETALRYANSKGALVISAAGNGDRSGTGLNNEIDHHYPSDFRLDGNISVAAVNTQNKLAVFSNYGVHSVDIAAPGGDMSRDESVTKEYIMSADMYAEHNLYIGFSGTSMATPVVAGVAALVKSANPELTPAEIKAIIMASGDDDAEEEQKTVSQKIVNAHKAVKMAMPRSLAKN